MVEGSPDAVDLVVNTFERTYRRALAPGAIAAIGEANDRRFARRVALINNVADRQQAARLAQQLVAAGEIDEFHFVEDRLGQVLAAVELRQAELEPLLHYSDAPLVAATLPGSPWLLYWDPEARLLEPGDWISPALALMGRDERVMAANPSWERPDAEGRRPGVEREAVATVDGFALGSGFSDQVFLAARRALAAPIYRQRCIARIAYPAAHKAHVFEARVDAHMRHHGRLRATSLSATYATDAVAEGGSSYPPRGLTETARYVRNALTLRTLALTPWRPRCLRRTWI
ncbi:MAG TPA: hypothetical protein VK605_08515 [Solirubrobacteraceae bacterium]|nr:hypothetical protein [Solirubrobacteraceae bacterium]